MNRQLKALTVALFRRREVARNESALSSQRRCDGLHGELEQNEQVGLFILVDRRNIDLLLERVPFGKVPMVYELRTSSMSCGPVSSLMWVGFDLV